ncbi:hypothetical protein J5N97_016704 [Dioscorea zingiberensis]|uniref:LisH domain-containing protein n=1 Tax=Dioscorea zingiberensis TaxID=325984 RepID=A0A9D5CKW3_9LILI|nr:hypothetical protein J5N97_016704 [Dioscorea zingiberensis]
MHNVEKSDSDLAVTQALEILSLLELEPSQVSIQSIEPSQTVIQSAVVVSFLGVSFLVEQPAEECVEEWEGCLEEKLERLQKDLGASQGNFRDRAKNGFQIFQEVSQFEYTLDLANIEYEEALNIYLDIKATQRAVGAGVGGEDPSPSPLTYSGTSSDLEDDTPFPEAVIEDVVPTIVAVKEVALVFSTGKARLKHYIYDYMIKKNLHASAEAFKNEVDIPLGSTVIDDFEGGFLSEWWEIFSEFYFSKLTNQGDQQVTLEEFKHPRVMTTTIPSQTLRPPRPPKINIPVIGLPNPELFEFLQSKDFFATDKNRGLDDFIDLNDVCLEDNLEKALFPKEKDDIAEPSTMILKQGPAKEEDDPKGDGDEMTEV